MAEMSGTVKNAVLTAIVTGDDDLHALGSYEGIPILTPAECLRRVASG